MRNPISQESCKMWALCYVFWTNSLEGDNMDEGCCDNQTKMYPRHLQNNPGKNQDVSTYPVSGILPGICIERRHTFKYKDIYYVF